MEDGHEAAVNRARRAARAAKRAATDALMGSFQRDLRDPRTPVAVDPRRRSRVLLIAFGGMRGGVGMPPFEFLEVTGALRVKRIFVRDLRQSWYHRGVPGLGDTLEAAANSLADMAAEQRADRVVMTGNSAGGYAALAFGALIGADEVVCFAPQTVLDRDTLRAGGALRGDERLVALVADGKLPPLWADLRLALPAVFDASAGAGPPRMKLFYDRTLHVDRFHSEHLRDVANVELLPRYGGAHGAVRAMRESGELGSVLRSALRGD